MFFVIPEMQSKSFVMVLKKLPDHFNVERVFFLQEDETMGLSFKKELTLAESVLFPPSAEPFPAPTRLQERLLK